MFNMDRNKAIQTWIPEIHSIDYVTCELDTTKQSGYNKLAFNNKCRICLETGNIPIFGNELFPDISADVTAYGDIEVSIEDIFPKYICETCAKLLEAAVLFRKTAKQSDVYLRGSQQNYENFNSRNELLISPKLEIVTDYEDIKIKEETTAESFYLNDNNSYIEATSLRETINIAMESNTNGIEDGTPNLLLMQNNYCCKTCSLNFQSLEEYSHHKKSAKHKKTPNSNKMKCKVCFKKVSKDLHKRHMEHHANDNRGDKLQCPICNKSYSKTYFNYHLTHTHNEDNEKAESDRVQCSICNKSYEKHYYKFHLAIHNNDSSKYVCDTCGKSFIQQSAFKRHRLIHGNELAFKCTLCPYRGRHPGLVKTHMQTHTRDYQHRCMECPARFLTKSNLNKHLQRHKGPVDFKCETCKRGFYSKLELDRHYEADHLGVKKHMCNVCGKAFGYRNAMMSHQLKVHKRDKLTNGKGRLPLYLEAERNNVN